MADTAAPSTRFTDQLIEENRETWDAAVTHRFVQQLFDGTLPDEDMASYLVQDYRFVDGFMALIGAAIATADNFDSRHRLAEFIGEVAGDENTYFVDAMEELGGEGHGSGASERDSIPDTAPTAGFKAIFAEAAETRNYAAIFAVLVVCEWLYLDWATRPENRSHGTEENGYPTRHVHAEWVRLHDYPEFHELVEFLRAEVDRAGRRSEQDAALAREYFRRTVDLELDFFDASVSG
ncbi:MAG TPA: TenA family protein [Candidatus Corynebacterium avicola]|uniref:Aminopyrimidine aminohydrolase n=1 Tax=Candidatus Corynebacterium avicola TaxID=2838527 RepID=A0A9D1RPL6_9CORY|nr:TenA family protein [Candidatus Corynebacterium avicola]